ncbi:MAG TPA: ABC transporter ATP-binding protein, partial [Ornithinibacter sp.]|nr:ABC transporter ATP-binding protein [Ornithinibacter sp.]
VLFDGSPLEYRTGALRRYRRRVQLVLQDPTGALNPRQTVYESVAEGLRIHKVVAAKRAEGIETTEAELVSAALSKAGLRPPESVYMSFPHELSGGQRQRVVIAGALALEPDLLIADEPVSALDASIRGEILALLLRLRDEHGLTVLVVTHDLGLAWNIADRVAVMYLGRLVEVGPTEEVLLSPEHPYTQALLSVVPEVAHLEPVVLSGEAPDPTAVPTGCRFHPRCQALQGGAAAEAGVADLCTGHPLPMLGPEGDHRTACWISLGRPAESPSTVP